MSWSASTYARPTGGDYVRALFRPWALLLVATAEMFGQVRGGPYQAILCGLALLPVIWMLGPAGWPWLRMRLRHHRRIFGLPAVEMPRNNWQLPAVVALNYLVGLGGLATVFHLMGKVVSPWWWLTFAGLLLLMVLLGEEVWIFYALESERRHERLAAAAIPHRRAVRLLRLIEGRAWHLAASPATAVRIFAPPGTGRSTGE